MAVDAKFRDRRATGISALAGSPESVSQAISRRHCVAYQIQRFPNPDLSGRHAISGSTRPCQSPRRR
jgi:hypothetical protein